MRRVIPFLLLLAVVATACNRDREARRARAVLSKALPQAMSFPGSSVITFSAGEDAAQIELSTMAPLKDVVAWYREALPLNGWAIQSDAVDGSGAVIIYAEKAKQPLWITLRANVGSPGTTYKLMGGVVEPDSTKAQSGSSMSSNRIQRR